LLHARPRPQPAVKLQVVDRLVELPFRMRASAPAGAVTWSIAAAERERVRILWPSTYQWEHTSAFVETVKIAMARLGVLRVSATPQVHPGVVRLFCSVDGRAHIVAIDYADRSDAISRDALAECSLYLKFQYREEGYADSRIIPGGYPVSDADYYRYYGAFRARHADDARIGVLGSMRYTYRGEVAYNPLRTNSAAH
jgi:hypothetical protein